MPPTMVENMLDRLNRAIPNMKAAQSHIVPDAPTTPH